MAEEKIKHKEYELVEVPTQMGIAIRTPTGEVIDNMQLLVKIANTLEELKTKMVG